MDNTLNNSSLYSGKPLEHEQVWEIITAALADHNLVLDKLLINGEEKVGDISFLLEELSVENALIEVVALEKKRYLDGQLLMAHDYLERAIPAAGDLADHLYQDPQRETWEGLSQLLEGLEWLIQFVNEMRENARDYSEWTSGITEEGDFKDPLNNLAEAINNNDPVLIGDVIRYEILELLETLLGDVKTVMTNEVVTDELH